MSNNMRTTDRKLWLLFISIFINFFGMSIAIPIFPSLVLKTGSFLIDPLMSSSSRLWVLMALMTMHPLGQLLASGFWGASSDRHGRRPIFLTSFFGSILGFIAMGYGILTSNLPLLFGARFFTGCAQGNLGVAQAVVSDVCDEASRPKFFGRLYACVSLAYVIGPPFAGWWVNFGGLSALAYASCFWMIAILLVVALLLLAKMEETHAKEVSESREGFHLLQTFKVIIQCFSERTMRIPFLVNTFVYFGIFSYFRFYTVHFNNSFDYSPLMLSVVVGYSGLFTMLSQFFLLKQLHKFFDSGRLLALSAIGLFVSMLSMNAMPSEWSFLYTLPFIGAAIGLTLPLCSLVIAEQTSRLSQGRHLGVNHCLQVIAEIFVGIIGGYVATLSCGLAIAFGGLVAAAGGGLLLRRQRQIDLQKEEIVDPE